MLSKEFLLKYFNFNKSFNIYTDTSDTHLGAGTFISQGNMPAVAFYSQKLTKAKRNFRTMERELLAIVEMLKEYRNIILGQTI